MRKTLSRCGLIVGLTVGAVVAPAAAAFAYPAGEDYGISCFTYKDNSGGVCVEHTGNHVVWYHFDDAGNYWSTGSYFV